MKVITKISEMQEFSDSMRLQGKRIGLVPTMGYLHEGHLSLVRRAKEKSDILVVSIFVNPTQFAPNEDFAKYPRDEERDKKLLQNLNVDVLFLPTVDEIYPHNFKTYVEVEDVTNKYEGEFRPAHFKGVATIVNILFNCVKPDIAVFGQKDAQQCAVIQRMVKDLKMDIEIIVAPIVREPDGLAMSSRNIYLSPEERKDALVIYRALKYAEKLIEGREMDPQKISDNMRNIIGEAKSASLDYIHIVNAYNFYEEDLVEQGNEYYVLVACRIGKTRLIDNLFVSL